MAFDLIPLNKKVLCYTDDSVQYLSGRHSADEKPFGHTGDSTALPAVRSLEAEMYICGIVMPSLFVLVTLQP